MSENPRSSGRIERRIPEANMIGLSKHTFSLRQYERVRRLLQYHTPPSVLDIVDVIIVPSTSPVIDLGSFNKRVSAAVNYATLYPEAVVLFSGKRPDVSRATEAERQPGYSEAAVMAQAAGFAGGCRVMLEERALHAGQNIQFSLDMLQGTNLQGILVISSGYMARRLSFYLKKALSDRGFSDTVRTFTFDADVAEDLLGIIPISDAEIERKRDRFLYEAKRLSRYRRKGDL